MKEDGNSEREAEEHLDSNLPSPLSSAKYTKSLRNFIFLVLLNVLLTHSQTVWNKRRSSGRIILNYLEKSCVWSGGRELI